MRTTLGLGLVLFFAACEGPAGEAGAPGMAGAMGAQGAQGAAGQAGVTGPQGQPGGDGKPGEDGVDGKAGTPGVAGARGETGPQGTPGKVGDAAGDGARVVSSIGCAGPLEGTLSSFSYSAVVFRNGNVFASASAGDGLIRASGAEFYAPSQAGAKTAPVFVNYDNSGLGNGGWWKLSLNRTTNVVTIEYNDAGKMTWNMTPDKCVVNKYQ